LRTWRWLMMDGSGSTDPVGVSTTATSGSGRYPWATVENPKRSELL
jgi:hypothetical protein